MTDAQVAKAMEEEIRKQEARAMEFMYNPAKAYDTTRQVINERTNVKVELTFPWMGSKNVVDPFIPKTYSILQGRPSEGKTAFGLCIAQEWARQAQAQDPNAVVVYATWEPRVEELVAAIMLPETGISVSKMLSGRTQWSTVADKLQPYTRMPLFIFSNSAARKNKQYGNILNMATIQPGLGDLDRAMDMWARSGYNVVAVVVDYLQLAADATFPNEYNDTKAVGKASLALKMLADKHDTAVLALAQSKQDADNYRWDYTYGLPRFGDIQWASKIGQDADRVFAIGSMLRNTDLVGQRVCEVDLGIRPGTQNKHVKFTYEIEPNRYVFGLQKQRNGFPVGRWVIDLDPKVGLIKEVVGLTEKELDEQRPF